MLRNRSLQVKVVDDNQRTYNAIPAKPIEIDIRETAETIAKCTAGVIATYMACDALRQICIYGAMQKLQAPPIIQLTEAD